MRRAGFLLLALLAVLASAGPARGQAQPGSIGIRLLDAPANRSDDPRAKLYIVDHLAPGTRISRRVEVSNDTDRPQTISAYAAAATVQGGAFQFGEGRASNDLTLWTQVEPPTLNLAARTKGEAVVTISVPPNASPGERYAVVWAEVSASAPAGGGIAAVNRVGVRIYLSVGPGGEPAADFAITELEGRRDDAGNPTVVATVKNTGGRALDLSGELQLTKGPGGLSAGPFPAKVGTTLGVGQTEPVLVTLDRALPNGPWTARVVLRSGLTEREVVGIVTFPDSAGGSTGAVPVTGDQGAKNAGGGGDRTTTGVIAGVATVVIVGLMGVGVAVIARRRPI